MQFGTLLYNFGNAYNSIFCNNVTYKSVQMIETQVVAVIFATQLKNHNMNTIYNYSKHVIEVACICAELV